MLQTNPGTITQGVKMKTQQREEKKKGSHRIIDHWINPMMNTTLIRWCPVRNFETKSSHRIDPVDTIGLSGEVQRVSHSNKTITGLVRWLGLEFPVMSREQLARITSHQIDPMISTEVCGTQNSTLPLENPRHWMIWWPREHAPD